MMQAESMASGPVCLSCLRGVVTCSGRMVRVRAYPFWHFCRDLTKAYLSFLTSQWRIQGVCVGGVGGLNPTPGAKFLFVHERGARWLPISTSNYYCILIGWKSAKVFRRCYFEPSQNTRMCSVEALGSGAGQTFSTDCHSSVSLSFPWWLPIITTLHVEVTLVLTASHHYCSHDDFHVITVPMMTFSRHYCSHDDFQWSQLMLSTLKQQLCWLPVIIVSMMTSSHHNKRNWGNPMWGSSQSACSGYSGNYMSLTHADWKSSGSSLMYE